MRQLPWLGRALARAPLLYAVARAPRHCAVAVARRYGFRYGGRPILPYWSACGSSIMRRSTAAAEGKSKSGKLDWHHPYAQRKQFSTTKGTGRAKMKWATKEVIASSPADYFGTACIIENTTHRDGSIYKRDSYFRTTYRIADRDETPLEPMTLSMPTDCDPDRETCWIHDPNFMMQIYALKLSKIPMGVSSVQLYGYIAVRDVRDSLLNYIVNHSRDAPITLKQGSFIEMTGPKRGISMRCNVLIEFDMRIKKGKREEDDLQLIDGTTDYCNILTPWRPFTNRINGDFGAVDITLALVREGVEATIEVIISKVQSGFHLSLSSFVFISESYQEIRHFNGTIGEPCILRRFVVAAVMDTWIHLVFKLRQNGSKNFAERYCSFKSNIHGCADRQIVHEIACVSVKVTWSTLPR